MIPSAAIAGLDSAQDRLSSARWSSIRALPRVSMSSPRTPGIAGAKMAIEENNAGGRFIGDVYSLDVSTVASADEAVEALQKLYDSGHHYIVVDASADTLLKLADWAKDKDILLFNVSATDVSLRQENCRANVMHVVPDRYMLADALAQYLVTMKWTNWLLVHGSTPADLAYADAIKRAASASAPTSSTRASTRTSPAAGATMSASSRPASRRASTAPFAANPDYQIIVVADEDQLFGPFMPYRGGGEPRPVAGTTGLIATTWSPGHEKWGATQANNNFEKDFNRLMLPIDYQAYVAARTIGEAVTRNPGRAISPRSPPSSMAPSFSSRPSRASSSNSAPGTVSSASRSSSPPTRCRSRSRRSAASRTRATPRSRWTRSASTSPRASARCERRSAVPLSAPPCGRDQIAVLVQQRHVVALPGSR